MPLHLQKCFTHLGWAKGDLPETERAAEQTLALPIFPELSADQQNTVIRTLQRLLSAAAGIAQRASAGGGGRPDPRTGDVPVLGHGTGTPYLSTKDMSLQL